MTPKTEKFWHRVAVLDDEGEAQQLQEDLLRLSANHFGGSAELGVAKESRVTAEPKPDKSSLILARETDHWLVTAWYGGYQ